MPIGPCLSPPEHDLGADAAPDAAAPDAGPPEPDLGPCLSPPPPDPEEGSGKATSPIDPAAIFDKVAAGLPPDIAARLKHRQGKG